MRRREGQHEPPVAQLDHREQIAAMAGPDRLRSLPPRAPVMRSHVPDIENFTVADWSAFLLPGIEDAGVPVAQDEDVDLAVLVNQRVKQPKSASLLGPSEQILRRRQR